jgi:hypothetical protein
MSYYQLCLTTAGLNIPNKADVHCLSCGAIKSKSKIASTVSSANTGQEQEGQAFRLKNLMEKYGLI